VSEKGGVSVYGLGRFPVTLYYEQWIRLLDSVAEVTAALRQQPWLERLFLALIWTLRTTRKGGYDPPWPQRHGYVTVMRHLLRLPSPVILLTDLVVQSAGFGLLVQSTGGALFFRPRQGSTRRAVAVAAVTPPANHHLPMTTPAIENPAI
jgi:hypothetical protein